MIILKFGIQPRFEFGFGLSYTSFQYSNLKIVPKVYGDEGSHESAWANGQVSEHGVGASLSSWSVNSHLILHQPSDCYGLLQASPPCMGGDVQDQEYWPDIWGRGECYSAAFYYPISNVNVGITTLLGVATKRCISTFDSSWL